MADGERVSFRRGHRKEDTADNDMADIWKTPHGEGVDAEFSSFLVSQNTRYRAFHLDFAARITQTP